MVAGYFFSLLLYLGVFFLFINNTFKKNIFFCWDTENLLTVRAGMTHLV